MLQTQAENAGAQEISRLLGAGLSARDHEIHHVFFYRKSAGCDDLPNSTMCCNERPSGLLGFVKFFLALVKTLKSINPDVIFTFQHFGNVVGAPAARLAGISPVIANQVSARETIHPVIRVLDLIMGWTNIYDKVTVNSHALMKDYDGFPNRYVRKIIHVPHGFEDKTSAISKSASRERFGLPQEVKLLGTVSRLNETKQLDCALQLLAEDASWHLAIAGQGPDQDRLQTMVSTNGWQNRIYFLGELSQQDIGDFLASLDVFVFPTRAETFGLAAVEAGQAGIPIVANNIEVLREVLTVDGTSCADLVDVRDIKAFAAAVRYILNNEEHACAMAARGTRLKDKYKLSHMIDAYEEMLAPGDRLLLENTQAAS